MAKIMIVDDSALSRRVLRGILERGGNEVAEAEEGLAALEKYSLEKPALVFLDMTMKGMHGIDVLREIRRLDPAARVIVATADIQKSTRALTDEAGASAFVQKPFDETEILAAIHRALGGAPRVAH